MSKVVIGADHAGFEMKEHLKRFLKNELQFEVLDVGCDEEKECDYPVFAKKAAQKVLNEGIPGILVCGTGIGMSIAANKIKGIRCAVCLSEKLAKLARQHNNANMLALGGRTMAKFPAQKVAQSFLQNEFSNEDRHVRRISQLEEE